MSATSHRLGIPGGWKAARSLRIVVTLHEDALALLLRAPLKIVQIFSRAYRDASLLDSSEGRARRSISSIR